MFENLYEELKEKAINEYNGYDEYMRYFLGRENYEQDPVVWYLFNYIYEYIENDEAMKVIIPLFEKDFPGTKIIKLEQNYRCTGNILKAANAVIKHNEAKYDKKLWTENGEGHIPCIYSGNDEYDEASYIINQIRFLKTEEYFKFSDFAILYRMNSQSRAIEDILRREDIPYKIIGGLKFYERKEIKDIIAYLRLIFNTSDNMSLKRIINEPKRGIGKTSLDNIAQISEAERKIYV